MAAITPTGQTQVESLGSLKLFVLNFTLLTTSGADTWVLEINAPVVAFWGQNNNGNQNTDPDIQWTPSTGTFTFTNGGTVGTFVFFVLMRT